MLRPAPHHRPEANVTPVPRRLRQRWSLRRSAGVVSGMRRSPRRHVAVLDSILLRQPRAGRRLRASWTGPVARRRANPRRRSIGPGTRNSTNQTLRAAGPGPLGPRTHSTFTTAIRARSAFVGPRKVLHEANPRRLSGPPQDHASSTSPSSRARRTGIPQHCRSCRRRRWHRPCAGSRPSAVRRGETAPVVERDRPW